MVPEGVIDAPDTTTFVGPNVAPEVTVDEDNTKVETPTLNCNFDVLSSKTT
jgi:hypothetical protein